MLAVVFAVVFVVALVVNHIVNTAGNPDEISAVIDDADLYDFVYDRVLDAAIADITMNGISVGNGVSGSETIQFEDPAAAASAIKGFIEEVMPREYVRHKVDETLNGVIPYVSGRKDSFSVDLETGERISALPDGVRVAAERLALGELIVSELISPLVQELSTSVTDQALGIGLTAEEADIAARRILPPEWIEAQVYSVVDQAAPYFAGQQDDMNIVITIKDRIPVAGQVLKDKLNDGDTLNKLVFQQVVDPLVAGFVADSTVLVFGIEITEADIQEAVEIVSPPDWVQTQGDGVIDSVVAWLVGATDNLTYTVELADRKADAAAQLEVLAMRKLDEQVAATPVCANPIEASTALNVALGGQFPTCLPANTQPVIDVMSPLISNQVGALITNSIPDQVTYSDADLRAQLPEGSLDTLDSLRSYVVGGISFTDEDLVARMAGDNATAQELADSRETLDVIRAGFAFDQTFITDRMEPTQLDQFNQFREWIALGWSVRWLVFAPALVLLLAIALIGGRGWTGRARWAGATVAVVSILFFASIQVSWASTAPLREFDIAPAGFGDEQRANFPALVGVIEGGDLQNMVERVGSAWVSRMAMSAVPWAVVGLVLFGVGYAYPRVQARRAQTAGAPTGGGSGRSDGWDTQPGDSYTDAVAHEDVAAAGGSAKNADEDAGTGEKRKSDRPGEAP